MLRQITQKKVGTAIKEPADLCSGGYQVRISAAMLFRLSFLLFPSRLLATTKSWSIPEQSHFHLFQRYVKCAAETVSLNNRRNRQHFVHSNYYSLNFILKQLILMGGLDGVLFAPCWKTELHERISCTTQMNNSLEFFINEWKIYSASIRIYIYIYVYIYILLLILI
jgi:hypothetical protein